MPHPILPSKLVSERITIRFDFLDELEWGETIASAAFSVSVLSGVDMDPNAILYSTIILGSNPTSVAQRIYAGIPGVLYNITCAVRGTSGQEYKKFSRLAILPGDAQLPPFIATYLTSTPYPAEQLDHIIFAMLPLSGILDTVIKSTSTRERISFAMEPLSGEMGPILETTTYRERISFQMIPQSGTMDTILVTYENLKERISFAMVPASGTMDTILVTNNYRERMSFAMIPLSGTMTS